MESTLSKIEDTDIDILNKMDDETLINFCKSSKYGHALCQKPAIIKRIELYKLYKTFNVMDAVPELDEIVYRPYMFYKIDRYIETFHYNFYIFDDDFYEIIHYVGVLGKNIGQFALSKNIYQFYTSIEDIMKMYDAEYDADDNENGLDVLTVYNIYKSTVLNIYAVRGALRYLQDRYNTIKLLSNTNFNDYYKLLGMYFYFKIQVIMYGLVNEDIPGGQDVKMRLDYLQSDRGLVAVNELKNGVMVYYDMLVDYILHL